MLQADLEAADGVAGKYTAGLGQVAMAVPSPAQDAAALALTATAALLEKHGVDPRACLL